MTTNYGEMIGDAAGLTSMRKALGMTQGALAKTLGLDAGTISRWERGSQNIANPDLLGYAMIGVAAREVAGADAWRTGRVDEITVTPALVAALAMLRDIALKAGIVPVAGPAEPGAAG